MQEAGEKIDAAEAELKKMEEAVKPFLAEVSDQLAAEEAEAVCKKLTEVSQARRGDEWGRDRWGRWKSHVF